MTAPGTSATPTATATASRTRPTSAPPSPEQRTAARPRRRPRLPRASTLPRPSASPPRSSARRSGRRSRSSARRFDDFGTPTVTVFDDDGTVCVLSGPPYSCTWHPTGADVGRATLLASAVDADRRSSLGSVRVRVARFEADLASKRRGRKVTGRLVLPQAVEKALGCQGEVTVRRKKVRRTVELKRNCTFSVRSRPARASRRRGSRATRWSNPPLNPDPPA